MFNFVALYKNIKRSTNMKKSMSLCVNLVLETADKIDTTAFLKADFLNNFTLV